MSASGSRSPRDFSRKGFQPLVAGSSSNTIMPPAQDATIDIPLTPVDHQNYSGASQGLSHQPTYNEKFDSDNDRAALFQHGGKRKLVKVDSKGQPVHGVEGEVDTLTQMGVLYEKILNFSIITRWMIYIIPIGICLAIPIICGATFAQDATLGGVRIVWFFFWLEIVWFSLWGAKLVAKCIPYAFKTLCGIVSAGTRKYMVALTNLEIPLSLCGWALTSLATFIPVMTRNPDTLKASQKDPAAGGIQNWESIVQKILAAAMVAALIYLAEKTFIQLISMSYHRKQFDDKLKTSKHNIYLLTLLYDASRTLFPPYCPEFAEEDYLISEIINLRLGSSRKPNTNHKRSESATPMRLLQGVGRVGDKITSAFGNIASEITGKQVFHPDSAHSIVVEALEKPRSSEALAKRLWMSFVVEGHEALFQEDVMEVLGPDHRLDAEECFALLDRDANGDVSLEECILSVTDLGRERLSLSKSMLDIEQAIKILDELLAFIAFVIVVFVFVAFLNSSFTTTLATAGTTLLSLSFVFSVTAQEVLGSCIFLFVKHPYDVGDRVDITSTRMTVEHISLLFTVFKEVDSHKRVQVPNNVLNTLWVENVSRSKAMREQIILHIDFGTSFEDIQLLKQEIEAFLTDKDNSRDFQPNVDLEVRGVGDGEMSKLELCIHIMYKSNWSNESVRINRRSKFVCALVLALRRIPLYGPGGSDPPLGDLSKPSYSVTITDAEAAVNRAKYGEDLEGKRMIPTKKSDPKSKSPVAQSSGTDYLGRSSGTMRSRNERGAETNAVDALNTAPAGFDVGRDDLGVEDNSTLVEGGATDAAARQRSNDLNELQRMLSRQSTRGRRKPAQTPASAQPSSGPSNPQPSPPPTSSLPPAPPIPPQSPQRYNAYQRYPGQIEERDISVQRLGPRDPYELPSPLYPTSPISRNPPVGNAFAEQSHPSPRP